MENTQTVQAPYYDLTSEDYNYIEEMALFHDISLNEAYQRFLDGNPNGLIAEDDEDAWAV